MDLAGMDGTISLSTTKLLSADDVNINGVSTKNNWAAASKKIQEAHAKVKKLEEQLAKAKKEEEKAAFKEQKDIALEALMGLTFAGAKEHDDADDNDKENVDPAREMKKFEAKNLKKVKDAKYQKDFEKAFGKLDMTKNLKGKSRGAIEKRNRPKKKVTKADVEKGERALQAALNQAADASLVRVNGKAERMHLRTAGDIMGKMRAPRLTTWRK